MKNDDAPKSKRPTRLVFAGAISFFIALIVFAPASLIAPLIRASGANIQYQEITGTVWRGAFHGVSTGEVFLGDIDFTLRPTALLSGRISTAFTIQDGAALGSGRVNLHLLSQRVSVAQTDIAFDLSAVRRYSLFGIPYQGRIEARDANISWSRDGCVNAAGDIRTDVLDSSSKTLVGESLLLAGPAECKSGQMHVTLRGANSQGRTEINIAIDQELTYRVMASVDLGRADLENNLRRLGFEDGDGVLVYDVVGALKGAGS